MGQALGRAAKKKQKCEKCLSLKRAAQMDRVLNIERLMDFEQDLSWLPPAHPPKRGGNSHMMVSFPPEHSWHFPSSLFSLLSGGSFPLWGEVQLFGASPELSWEVGETPSLLLLPPT